MKPGRGTVNNKFVDNGTNIRINSIDNFTTAKKELRNKDIKA
jgi:hypothetical protein